MNELTYDELLRIHQATLIRHGGLPGVKDEGFLLSALDQPAMSFGGEDLYPTIAEKAAALGFSLAKNHAFNDGNKRVSFAAMSVFLLKNGYLLEIPEQEVIRFMLDLAASQVGREELVAWIQDHIEPLEDTVIESSPSSFSEITPLSDKAKQIEKARPPYWRVRMLAQVLADEIDKIAQERIEHKQGFSSATKINLSPLALFGWIDSEMEKRELIIESQGRIINLLSDMAFFESDSGGNLDFMISLAREVGGVYREIITWSQQFRRVYVSTEYERLLSSIAGYFNEFVDQIENLPQTLLNELEMAESWNGPGPYKLQITLNFAPEDSGIMSRELRSLSQKLGLSDENGFSSLEHIDIAISTISEIWQLQTQSLQEYVKKLRYFTESMLRLADKPKSIEKPQRDALEKMRAQSVINCSRDIKATFDRFEAAVDLLEKHSPLIGSFVHPELPESVSNANDRLESLDDLYNSCTEIISTFKDIKEDMGDTQGLTASYKFASQDMTDTIDKNISLIEKVAISYSVQIKEIEVKIKTKQT